MSEQLDRIEHRIESIAASIEEAHDKLAESIGKNAQMDKLAHFVEFCFGEQGRRESLFTAICVVREYLTASCFFSHEDVDVFFATSKRNAFEQKRKTP